MTWENLTADPDALQEELGFERYSVLGHSFGGHVALEDALRDPERVPEQPSSTAVARVIRLLGKGEPGASHRPRWQPR